MELDIGAGAVSALLDTKLIADAINFRLKVVGTTLMPGDLGVAIARYAGTKRVPGAVLGSADIVAVASRHDRGCRAGPAAYCADQEPANIATKLKSPPSSRT